MADGRGRPLRALLIGAVAWVALRATMLWPDASEPIATGARLADRASAPTSAVRRPIRIADLRTSVDRMMQHPGAGRVSPTERPRPQPTSLPPLASVAPPLVRDAPAAQASSRASDPVPPVAPTPVSPGPAPSPVPSRWSGSAWAIVRGRGAAGVATPQLGGSQAGARLAYRLDDRGRLAVAGRVAAALADRQQEAAIGVEWQPTVLPVRLVVERRIGVANVRGGTGVGVAGGGRAALPLGFALDGYAQGGAIARGGVEGYADGAARLGRVVAASGGVALDLGLGAWGAAQRGAERIDVGPSAALSVPLANRRVRLSLDWRQRVAGRARPGSGPAVSLGTDF